MFDYQQVNLIAVTKPLNLSMNASDLISYCARVSNPSNQKNFDTSSKLLKYCYRNEHWSIFEMVNVVLEIRTTRDIARQILRHRSFSFQEFSQRYAEVTNNLTSEHTREARLQDNKNRQNSIETDDIKLQREWDFLQKELNISALKKYQWALDNGIAKEVARSILPEGLTESTLYMNGTLRSWIHYCVLRMGNGTQKEHRDISTKAWELLKEEFWFLESFEEKE